MSFDRTNRVAFYPGSVFKMVVAAGVLEENLVQPEEKFICTGTYTFLMIQRSIAYVNMER